jgi:hypothetical protein
VQELEDVAEAIEASALEGWYRTVALVGAKTGTARDGRVLAACLAGTSDPMVNRVCGLGLGVPATEAGVDALLGWFREHNVSRFLVHASPSAQPAELRQWLLARGLRRHRSWMKFGRGREAVKRPESSLEVRRIGIEHAGEFARVACEVFHLPAQAAPIVSRLAYCEGWHLFGSFDGKILAGVGALYVSNETGWLGFGATDPEFRGRGGQASVLAARLETALELGCRLVVTETGEAVPGDKQHSYKNILRAGFRELYLRENFLAGAAER